MAESILTELVAASISTELMAESILTELVAASISTELMAESILTEPMPASNLNGFLIVLTSFSLEGIGGNVLTSKSAIICAHWTSSIKLRRAAVKRKVTIVLEDAERKDCTPALKVCREQVEVLMQSVCAIDEDITTFLKGFCYVMVWGSCVYGSGEKASSGEASTPFPPHSVTGGHVVQSNVCLHSYVDKNSIYILPTFPVPVVKGNDVEELAALYRTAHQRLLDGNDSDGVAREERVRRKAAEQCLLNTFTPKCMEKLVRRRAAVKRKVTIVLEDAEREDCTLALKVCREQVEVLMQSVCAIDEDITTFLKKGIGARCGGVRCHVGVVCLGVGGGPSIFVFELGKALCGICRV
ncbi:hypothetical protein FHG87_002007 [Trinorchestia longiramus]|nr:hypothetical protein FHG87_002007 [Trinorchestia longiramus]